MKASTTKVRIGIALLAVAVMVAVVSLVPPRLPASDAGSRTVVIQTHHGTHRVHVSLPATKVANTTESGTTLSGNIDFRLDSRG